MAFHLSESSVELALKHICFYGDTDVFPYQPEINFFADEKDEIIARLSRIDLDNYQPTGVVEALAPKSKYGFRICHQIPAIDTVLMLASVLEIAESIEALRSPAQYINCWSYRLQKDSSTGQIFREDRTFRDWLTAQQNYISLNQGITNIISTDISDFYSRINFHRLENLLDEAAGSNHGAVKFLKRHIKKIRAKQSFGLPVGGNAARLLSELALKDTDQFLVNSGYAFTRFVDDYRIFLNEGDHPYDVLGALAEQLSINEGLSLNASKTNIRDRKTYFSYLEHLKLDVSEHATDLALGDITARIYFDHGDDIDEELLAQLKCFNLVELLTDAISSDEWDSGQIKLIFRALKIDKPLDIIPLIIERFPELIIFSKDLCLLMEEMNKENPGCFNSLSQTLINAIVTPPAASIHVIRIWLLEIIVRGIVPVSPIGLGKLTSLSSPVEKRQLSLIRGRQGDVNYFRRNKTAVQSFAPYERYMLAWGASCLPVDEYTTWLATLRDSFTGPIDDLFLKWLKNQRGNLFDQCLQSTRKI